MADKIVKIGPQNGYQLEALMSPADIVIGGGAAGVGKTFTLLLEPLRHIHVKGFGAVIFRRTSPMIRAEGGLWDSSAKLYQPLHGVAPRQTALEWQFPQGPKVKFSHLEYEKNIYDWQGSEIPFIGFDELTHFTKKMFFYLLSRNRSTCGVNPYVRATCNPDPDSWVAELVDWWIGEDGFPNPDRAGKMRYFMADNDNYIWGDTKDEVVEKGWHVLRDLAMRSGIDPREFVKSITFIGGSIYDNKALLETNPQYLGNLNAQTEDEKARLLYGNWRIKNKDEDIYSYQKFHDIFTNSHVRKANTYQQRYITTDIAMKGSDKMIIMVWHGRVLIDLQVLPKTRGNQVISALEKKAFENAVPYSNVAFDNDGVGSFVDGFIEGAKEFNNGGRPKNGEAYNHLKSQCFFKSGGSVDRGEYYVMPHVAEMKYDDKMTVKQRLMYERKCVKRDKPDNDGKLRVIGKAQMKPYINGQSPDMIETFMMREFFDMVPSDPEIYYS